MSRVETQYVVTPATLTDGQFGMAMCDSSSRLMVVEQFAAQSEDNTNGVIAQAVKPLASSTYSASLYTNFGAQVTQNIKATSGNQLSFVCRNNSGAIRYIQFHDTTTTPVSGMGTAPKLSFRIETATTLALGRDFFGPMGLYFTNGIAMAMSTTEATYTAGTATDVTLHVTYK